MSNKEKKHIEIYNVITNGYNQMFSFAEKLFIALRHLSIIYTILSKLLCLIGWHYTAWKSWFQQRFFSALVHYNKITLCMCVCVWAREREREMKHVFKSSQIPKTRLSKVMLHKYNYSKSTCQTITIQFQYCGENIVITRILIDEIFLQSYSTTEVNL